jgi:hypothetical protein
MSSTDNHESGQPGTSRRIISPFERITPRPAIDISHSSRAESAPPVQKEEKRSVSWWRRVALVVMTAISGLSAASGAAGAMEPPREGLVTNEVPMPKSPLDFFKSIFQERGDIRAEIILEGAPAGLSDKYADELIDEIRSSGASDAGVTAKKSTS